MTSPGRNAGGGIAGGGGPLEATAKLSKLTTSNRPSTASRPATALSRVLDKFSAVSGINLSLPLHHTASSAADRALMLNKGTPSPMMAYALQAKIAKIIKTERKNKTLKLQLIDDLRAWSAAIPSLESETMISEFASLLLSQLDTATSVVERLDNLRLNLLDVHEREKKQKDLYVAKEKLLKQLKDSEAKHGAAASGSTLLKEKLEENICNLEVVELQYLRSINKSLKESIIEYLVCLQTTASVLEDATQDYYGCLLAIEQGVLSNGNGNGNKSSVATSNGSGAPSGMSHPHTYTTSNSSTNLGTHNNGSNSGSYHHGAHGAHASASGSGQHRRYAAAAAAAAAPAPAPAPAPVAPPAVAGIRSRKEYLSLGSGSLPSLRSGEYPEYARMEPQQQEPETKQGSPKRPTAATTPLGLAYGSEGGGGTADNTAVPRGVCSECQKVEKYTRSFTPCTHYTESRDSLKVRDYMPADPWG